MLKPYYETDLGVLYHGDCLEIMPELEPVDLVFADPPFNINKPYKDKRENYQEWCADWICECFRLLKDTGSFYHMTITRHLEWKMALMAKCGAFVNLITWRNVGAVNNKRSFWNEYQPIMLYGKTENYKFNTYAEVDHGSARRWGRMTTEYKGQKKDRWDDIPFIHAGKSASREAILLPGTFKKAHPCQMPRALAQRAVLFSTDKADVVIDMFFGTGATASACERLNRSWIGIEIEEKYCEIAAKRIENERKQLKLF